MSSENSSKQNLKGVLVSFGLLATLLGLIGVGLLNRQNISDHISVWSYKPSAQVQEIAETAALTDNGRFIFYATKPELASSETFNESCPRVETDSPILGCYAEDRIFVYDITNQNLNGMEQVTATHEMLHAVWFRHGNAERQQLEILLVEAYNNLGSAELKERMDYYKRTEPGEFINELHSILGTEINSLGSELETYYNQYFNRSKLLEQYKQYNTVYESLNKKAEALYAAMEELAQNIESESLNYTNESDKLDADIQTFNSNANNGNFLSMESFYAQRSQLQARLDSLEAKRLAVNELISKYNNYNHEYTEVGNQLQALNKSVDSYSPIESTPSI